MKLKKCRSLKQPIEVTQRIWLAMEDDCWSIEALRDVNSLAASIALKKNLMVSVRLSPI
jgi:hypothetical protein